MKVTSKNYAKNPAPETVKFLIKNIFENMNYGIQSTINRLAHRYLLYGPLAKNSRTPSKKDFVGAIALLQDQGLVYFNKDGRSFTERPINIATTRYVASLARQAFYFEQRLIEKDYQEAVEHSSNLSVVR